MKVKLFSYTGNPEKAVAFAGKNCYSEMSLEDLYESLNEEEVTKFVRFLLSVGHTGPFEMASFQFGIEGVSRITEIQLVRKRMASYAIRSGRYVKRDEAAFHKPSKVKESRTASIIFDDMAEQSVKAYNELFLVLMLTQMNFTDLEIQEMSPEEREDAILLLLASDRKKYKAFEKTAIEDARSVHMQSLETTIVVSMNARALREFFEDRMCRRAQEEIQEMASLMLQEVYPVAPNLFHGCGPSCVKGACKEGKMTCGNPFPRIKKEGEKNAK